MRAVSILLCSAALAIPGVANAASFTLFNTGVDSTGAVLPNGSAETHFALSTGPARVATAANGWPIGPWLGDNTTSAWIGPVGNSQLSSTLPGPFDYTQSFSLAGFDASTASITGQWASDDIGSIFLNGVQVAGGNTVNSYYGWTPFSISGGFVAGVNQLTFRVLNTGGGPTGVRVEMAGSARAVQSAVPEPATWLSMILGFGLLGAAMRRRAARPAVNFRFA